MSIYFLCGIMLILMSSVMLWLGLMFLMNEGVYLVEYYICEWGGVDMKYEMLFDWISCFYSGVILLISGSVIIYSEDYMYYDINKSRFLMLMMMFVISMLMMVVSSGLISIMLGWDGLGLVSYCLVIYYNSMKSYKSGMITISSNRVGDTLLLVSVGWVLYYGDWNFWLLGYENMKINNYVVLMIVIASCTKSAQIPFSAWLPEAMAAPTPVSSLVHSSTLVTAGIYLMIRFNYFFQESSYLLMILSVMTMFMAGLGALVEMDMKKIVAMSTLSQLGLSMFCISINLWKLAYFHMVIHAFFKALMFMCVGSVIHGSGGCQDMRSMTLNYSGGWLVNQGLLVSVLCLSGFPFMCGFFSKDLLLEVYLMSEKNLFCFMLFLLGFCMSVMYGARLYWGCSLSWGSEKVYSNYSEMKWMNFSILVLMFSSLLSGSMMIWCLKFNYSVILSEFWKLMGILFMVIIMFMVIFYKFMFYYKSFMFIQLKNYMGSMFFFKSSSGGIFMKMMEKMESVEIIDQNWMEEMGFIGIKENFLKKIFFLHDKMGNISYFYMMIYFIFVILVFMYV